jgi:elongator complex protein 3
MYKPTHSNVFSDVYASTYKKQDIEDIFTKERFKITLTPEELELFQTIFIKSQDVYFFSHLEYNKFMNKYTHNKYPKTKLVYAYRMLLQQNKITRNHNLEHYMKFKGTRGNSGILQITTMMSGQLFGDSNNIKNGGCPHKCIYCPLEVIDGVVTQPRSYVTLEPANQRASQNKHHPVGQVFDRLHAFEKMGHLSSTPENPAKIEFMISGGTFNFFPEDYIEWFVTMSYYALNVYYDYTLTGFLRDPLSLEEEQKLNETSAIRMIGLTIETRPDYLTSKDDLYKVVRFFRRLGVTRVQTGVQHTDDTVLKKVKRDCTDRENQIGNIILMSNCFKVDNHWMLDLPTSTPEMDQQMIDYLFTVPNYAVDQIKIYPTMVIEHSELYDMYQRGEYVPYAEQDEQKMIDNIAYFLEKVPYYMRVNRVIRDFFADAVIGGVKNGDMRKSVEDMLRDRGVVLRDIRCREVKDSAFDEDDCYLFVDKYDSCGGINYFISFENNARTKLYGFTRLRFNTDDTYTMPELINHALIRELHVYGNHTGVGGNSNNTQHRGLGTKLLEKAEKIAALNGYDQITVISGVGVREYYRKRGYTDYHTFLTKNIDLPMKYHIFSFVLAMLVLVFAFMVMCI